MTTRTLPEHGTEARYQGALNRPGCRCRTCINGWTRAGKRRQLARLEGRPATVPSGPITAHLRTLLDHNMSAGQIAAAAGVNRNTITDHAAGRFPKLRRTTAHKILAVQAGQYGDTGRVPALGTRRRIQALFAVGHGLTSISAASGLTNNGIAKIAYGKSSAVSISTRDTIAAIYPTLIATPGTSHRARKRAVDNEWAPPGAWDDIEDPDAQPETDDERPLGWQEAAALRRDEALRLASFGVSEPEIARRVGRSESYVRQILAGARGPGWRHRLDTAA